MKKMLFELFVAGDEGQIMQLLESISGIIKKNIDNADIESVCLSDDVSSYGTNEEVLELLEMGGEKIKARVINVIFSFPEGQYHGSEEFGNYFIRYAYEILEKFKNVEFFGFTNPIK